MTENAAELDAGVPPEVLADERAAARKALRRLHKPAGDGGTVCDWCRLPYPCPDSGLAADHSG